MREPRRGCCSTSGRTFAAKDGTGATPLHRAVWRNAYAVAELLLDRGAAVDAPNDYGATPLHYAVWNNAGAAERLLRDRGAAQDATDDAGRLRGHEFGALLTSRKPPIAAAASSLAVHRITMRALATPRSHGDRRGARPHAADSARSIAAGV